MSLLTHCGSGALPKYASTFVARKYQALYFFAKCRRFQSWPGLCQASANALSETSEGAQHDIRASKAESGAGTGLTEQITTIKCDGLSTDQNSRNAQSHHIAEDIQDGSSRIKTRQESRMERKLRRQRDGTYRRASRETESAYDAKLQSEMDALISHIDQLATPSKEQDNIIDSGKDVDQAQSEVIKVHRRKEKAGSASKSSKAVLTEKNPPGSKTGKKHLETWQVQKRALEHKFGDEGWKPRKRLSPDTVDGIRSIHASDPSKYPTAVLADHFKVSPEAIRRILRSKWQPTEEEAAERSARWQRRGMRNWEEMSSQGARPPAKWRSLGVGRVARDERAKKFGSGRNKGRRDQNDAPIEWNDAIGRAAFSELERRS